jgi:hypothetical protein
MQSKQSACGTWCSVKKGIVEKCLMTICGLLHIIGIHICLTSTSKPWLKQIRMQYCTCRKIIQSYGQEVNNLKCQKLTM